MCLTHPGLPASRTPSPPCVRAQKPREPAPEKRRPCVRARSQCCLRRTTGSGSPVSGEISPSTSSSPRDAAIQAQRLRPAASQRDNKMLGSLSKSTSSPCLVVEGLHDQHSQQQQKLIAGRDLYSEVFGIFSTSYRAEASGKPDLGAANTSMTALSLRCSRHHAAQTATLTQRSSKQKMLKMEEPARTTSPGATTTLGLDGPKRSSHSEMNVVEEKRRLALDAKLSKALFAELSMVPCA